MSQASHQILQAETFRYRVVERRVLELIETGTLEPGQRVPSIRRMSATLGVGIASVNHAYLELERKGVLESRPRSGFFVRAAPGPELPGRTPGTPGAPQPSTRSGLIGRVLESVGDRDLVPFGVVCPQEELLPTKALARMAGSILRERPDVAISYAPIPGTLSFRRELAHRLSAQGLEASQDHVLVTNGCIEALNISLRCLTRPGDIVCIQSPTYYCFLQLLETLGLRCIEVPSCPSLGIDPRDVHTAVTRYDVKACIFSANFNNPDGALTPEAARREIVAMLAERDVPLVEDDVYGDLHFGPERPGTFKQHDEKGLVLYCSSLSKTLAPGYRLGWMLGGRFLEKALELKATTSVSSASLLQEAAAAFMRSGKFEKHLHELRGNVEQVMRTIRHHAAALFPEGTRMTRPSGGLVLWLELPREVDGVELFYRAREQGVGIAPGSIFTTRERYESCIRLSCGVVWNEKILQGLRTLAQVAAECRRG